MKIAPLEEEFAKHPHFETILVHTGQHYDQELSQFFFEDLGIRKPDFNLGIGSGSYGEQVGRILVDFEKFLKKNRPDLVIVVGDVNSTIACALASTSLGIPLAHVEAGLRSFDRTMPEEINRTLTDALADLLFTTCREARDNLEREGIAPEKIHFVGNVMIDTLLKQKDKAKSSKILNELGLKEDSYATLTLHRPSNVDNIDNLTNIIEALEKIQYKLPIIFPTHPRTRKRMAEFSLEKRVASMKDLIILQPLSYYDFLKLMRHSKVVLTDAGGIQEETTILGVPCVTLRENTERPITVREGTNVLAGIKSEGIIKTFDGVLGSLPKEKPAVPELWDGKAAERIVHVPTDYGWTPR